MPDLSADLVARQARADYVRRSQNLRRLFDRRTALKAASADLFLYYVPAVEVSARWVCVPVGGEKQ